MKKYLTESAAWARIARDIRAGCWYEFGLCNEVQRIYTAGLINRSVRAAMDKRIKSFPLPNSSYAWSGAYIFEPGVAAPRIRLARRFAKQSK